MWVKINKTDISQLGTFIGGNKYDLPEKTIDGLRDALGKENVIDTCAPWEEHVDKKAVTVAELKSKAEAAIKTIEEKNKKINELQKIVHQIGTLQKEVNRELPEAVKLAKKAGIDWPKKA